MNRLTPPRHDNLVFRRQVVDFSMAPVSSPAHSTHVADHRHLHWADVVHAAKTVEHAIAWPFETIAFTLAQDRKREQLRTALKRMEDWELKDIGIDRSQIDTLVNRAFPLWPARRK